MILYCCTIHGHKKLAHNTNYQQLVSYCLLCNLTKNQLG